MKNVKIIILLIIYFNNILSTPAVQGIKVVGNKGIQETTEQIMSRPSKHEKIYKIIRHIRNNVIKKQNKSSLKTSQFPSYNSNKKFQFFKALQVLKAQNNPVQKIGLNFLGAQLSESSFYPPDSMGAVGPTQYFVAINGIFKTIDKNTGKPDGQLNIDPNVFFKSVCTCNDDIGTTDPRIRYDILTKRWFITMINDKTIKNRLMFAVSNEPIIKKTTKWTFFFIQTDPGQFFDQPTLGIDANALYIGGVPFTGGNGDKKIKIGLKEGSGDQLNSTVYVIQKKSILSTGPIVYHKFPNLSDAEDYQGVDNDIANSTDGYFISASRNTFGVLLIRKVFNPGSNNPTISPTFILNVPNTQSPIPVDHKGNNHDGTNDPNLGKLDVNDDRLLMGQKKNNSIWTCHHIGVNNLGISPDDENLVTRNGARWYEIDISKSQPVLKQSGTLFEKTATNSKDAASYFYPSIMVSDQGHMILASSKAGKNEYINAVFAGRLATDPLGTLRNPVFYTHSNTSYNPPDDSDPAQKIRRWGDYSYTSLDPVDFMSMWTIQEYCNAKNSWGCQVAKLLAPPPSTPIKIIPNTIPVNFKNFNLTIQGKAINGSAYCNPINAVNKLRVLISDAIVNKVTLINPQEIVVSVSTINSKIGLKDVTIINPDGQRVTAKNFVNIINCGILSLINNKLLK